MEKLDSDVVSPKSVTFACPVVQSEHEIQEFESSEHVDPASTQATCSWCLATPLGEDANKLLKCLSCDSYLCEECNASSKRSDEKNIETLEDCRCKDCGVIFSTQDEVPVPKVNPFSCIWKTSTCPVCSRRIPKNGGRLHAECSFCNSTYCK